MNYSHRQSTIILVVLALVDAHGTHNHYVYIEACMGVNV
jgi:hypothetical protein